MGSFGQVTTRFVTWLLQMYFLILIISCDFVSDQMSPHPSHSQYDLKAYNEVALLKPNWFELFSA